LIDLDCSTAQHYLAERFCLPAHSITVRELPGGVSNLVFRATLPGHPDLILKQSLAKLRVAEDWFSDRSRIFREIDSLSLLVPLAPPGSLPQVLFADKSNYLFAMSAAHPDAPTWKQQLLAGEIHLSLAAQAAHLHALFFQPNPAYHHFAGLDLFDQLRLDPYYRFTASRHPDLNPHFHRAIEQARTQLRALTHGDFSPKNFLVNPGPTLFSIDYEVIHFGDPSFDTAFLLNHFLLKAWHNSQRRAHYAALALHYWQTLLNYLPAEQAWLEPSTILHLGCLHLARVDGKSPVEYLRPNEKPQVRRFARDLIQNPPRTVAEVFEMQAEAFHE
jgi:5-methylthioribose kinase